MSAQGSEGGGYLVPGRECGGCTACCVALAIAVEDLKKMPGVPCQHCRASAGCAIYAGRPQVCRDYHCLWRSFDHLGEEWRPDRSGILMVWGEVPDGFPAQHAVDLILVGPAAVLQSDEFASMTAGFIANGTATFLSVPHGPGFLSPNAFLNPALTPAIAARNLPQVKALIMAFYEQMRGRTPVPVPATALVSAGTMQEARPQG